MMLEEVNGVMQGACVPLLDGGGLVGGINRLAFGPDGVLWTGQTHLSWAGAEGMRRISYQKGKDFQDVHTIAITKDGFRVKFLEAADDENLVKAELRRYRYVYHSAYGSPETDKADVEFKANRINETEFQLVLSEPLQRDFLYEFQFPNAVNPMVAYTVREVPEG
jgi:hypothetical protein